MKTKKISPSFIGLGALAIALCLNFVYASNDYGISDNSLSIEVLAQMNRSDSGDGTGTGTGNKKFSTEIKSEQNKTTVSCNGISHHVTEEPGYIIICTGSGSLDCKAGWFPNGGAVTRLEVCPGQNGDVCNIR